MVAFTAWSVQIRSFSRSDPNTGKYGPEKDSAFEHFSCSDRVEVPKRFKSFISFHLTIL